MSAPARRVRVLVGGLTGVDTYNQQRLVALGTQGTLRGPWPIEIPDQEEWLLLLIDDPEHGPIRVPVTASSEGRHWTALDPEGD